MARVKADIDAQRARIERIDAEQDFGTLLEQRAMATSGMDTRPGASH
jgi:hypothetical protein